jgi:hypothetical protein
MGPSGGDDAPPRAGKDKRLTLMARPQQQVIIRGALLAISCAISYWLITHILANAYSISTDDDLLGGMWAVVATIFVYRYSHAESVRAALSRMAATSVSFALCLIYLLIFPFHLPCVHRLPFSFVQIEFHLGQFKGSTSGTAKVVSIRIEQDPSGSLAKSQGSKRRASFPTPPSPSGYLISLCRTGRRLPELPNCLLTSS